MNQTTSSDSQPIINSTSFQGVIVASIEAKTLGNYLEGQVHPKFNGEIALINKNGSIIYS
ncbi:hypothetical protein [Candidatus Nitrosocosmicus franklandus]|uniref:Uncharacterized protein n=1 Tax=Candidatus Nitrosocosmicus franklandianus TaxID=1798806 RepID=A0A484IB93_9ARCH|nr:hypothetical protein [Candidatus Nitrosocosmicus franklandus]VFJ14348.1 protein of unknown function [Candidatus Nitrosocosmicus franklandus]